MPVKARHVTAIRIRSWSPYETFQKLKQDAVWTAVQKRGRSQKGREDLGKRGRRGSLADSSPGPAATPIAGNNPIRGACADLVPWNVTKPREAGDARQVLREGNRQRRSVHTRSHHRQAGPRRNPELSKPYSKVEMNNSKANSRNSPDRVNLGADAVR